jgi:hypothetical protein
MLIELIVLALATAIRPASLAVVYALLSSALPRRLMTVYLISGLAFTVSFGALVVWAFHGISFHAGSNKAKGIAQIAGGILAIAFCFLVLIGRLGGREPQDSPKGPGRWSALVDRHLTIGSAAIAGPATHIPGVFYLIALNLIVASNRQAVEGLAGILVYNFVWFVLPIIALVICIFRPAAAKAAIKAVQAWTSRRARPIMLVVSFAVGVTLVFHGATIV